MHATLPVSQGLLTIMASNGPGRFVSGELDFAQFMEVAMRR